jgi:drug/metabolite transporter (DMT)-like permease
MPVVVLIAIGVVAVSMSAPLAAGMTIPALAVAFWRNALGSLATAPSALHDVGRPTTREVRWMLLSGVALAVHFGCWLPSLRLTSVASATSLVSLQVAWVVAWEALNGRRYPRLALVGMVVAFVGTVIVSGVDLTVSARAITGDLLALVGGAGTAAYMVVGGRVRPTVRTATYNAFVYGTCAVVMLAVCLVGRQALVGYPARQWGLLLLLTATAQLLGHSVFNHLLETISATAVGLALLLEVPGASLLAGIFLDQRPPFATYVGLAVILAGTALVVRAAPPRDQVAVDV